MPNEEYLLLLDGFCVEAGEEDDVWTEADEEQAVRVEKRVSHNSALNMGNAVDGEDSDKANG
ncbi:MAG: hypothetical protein R3E01_32915 [Pirellulaceae bacterium]